MPATNPSGNVVAIHKRPRSPETSSIRLDTNLVDQLRELASRHDRTLTAELRRAVNAHLNRSRGRRDPVA